MQGCLQQRQGIGNVNHVGHVLTPHQFTTYSKPSPVCMPVGCPGDSHRAWVGGPPRVAQATARLQQRAYTNLPQLAWLTCGDDCAPEMVLGWMRCGTLFRQSVEGLVTGRPSGHTRVYTASCGPVIPITISVSNTLALVQARDALG